MVLIQKNDVYYLDDYVKLYLKSDQNILKFEFNEGSKQFYHITIKRPILLNNSQFDGYDLETAYGYGGFWINTQDQTFVRKALKEYEAFCQNQNIVAEFFRFHPFNDFPLNFGDYFDFLIEDRETVFVQLEKPYETIFKEYHSSLHRNLKKAVKNDLQFRLLEPTSEQINHFHRLYYQTMKKNNADSFYFFSESYFNKLFNLQNTKLFGVEFKGQIVNMVIILESFPFCYYHLGASEPEYYSLNGNPFLFDQLIKFYQQKFKIFYLGGGATPAPDDSLLRFKRKFSPDTKPFFIAGKIFNKEKYDHLIQKAEKKCPELKSVKYFLKYRLCEFSK